MTERRTLLFNRSSFEALLDMQDYISAVEEAHRLHAEGKIIETNLVHADAPNGEYHIKTGGLIGDNAYYGLKANGGFFNNRRDYNLPNILGIIYLSDANNAYPLAIFESSLISKMRTAAATAVAAKHLAPKGPLRLAVFGYGNQAEAQIEAMHCVADIESILISGRNEERAKLFASKTAERYHIPVTYTNAEAACKSTNTIITCTPSTSYLVPTALVNKGTFIAAVGADSPGKNELEPSIFANAKVVGDITSQIIKVGEAQHPIRQGIISKENIHGELGELIAGKIEGRTSEDEITIYDSTGTAIQDIACAAYIYEKLKGNPDILGLDLFR